MNVIRALIFIFLATSALLFAFLTSKIIFEPTYNEYFESHCIHVAHKIFNGTFICIALLLLSLTSLMYFFKIKSLWVILTFFIIVISSGCVILSYLYLKPLGHYAISKTEFGETLTIARTENLIELMISIWLFALPISFLWLINKYKNSISNV